MTNKPKTKVVVRNEDDSGGMGWAWLAAIVNPFLMFQAFNEVFFSWLFTRPWRRLCLFLPALLLVAVAVGLVAYGSFMPRATLQTSYMALAEEEQARVKKESETEDAETPRNDLMQQEQTSAFSDMLYRRLMQLDDENPRTRYMVATQLARSGRNEQARQLMQEIAPAGQPGFTPAHAWLAIDLLKRERPNADGTPNPLSKELDAELMLHLKAIRDWEGTSSQLLALYAGRLLKQGNQTEALNAMAKAAQKDPSLRGSLALMAKGRNKKLADESSADAIKALQEKIKSGDATPKAYIELTSLQLSANDLKAALDTARRGLNISSLEDEQRNYLKQLSSEALRLMYRESIRQTDKGVELNLALLDAALKEYPANPNISAEVARLTDMGIEAPPALKAAMEQQLVSGQATAVAHLLLANQELKLGNIAQAIPHLELSLKQAPTHPVTLNNLALALALTDTDQIERAEELIEQAIALVPNNPEYYDTQGEIRLIAGRPLDSLQSLEKAIGFDPGRRHTHELMVKAYRAAGLEDMAVVHEKVLAAGKPVKETSQDEAEDKANDKK